MYKCSLVKTFWQNLQDIQSNKLLVITSYQEDDSKELNDNLEPKNKIDINVEGTNCIKEDDDEENFGVEIKIDLKTKLVAALE